MSQCCTLANPSKNLGIRLWQYNQLAIAKDKLKVDLTTRRTSNTSNASNAPNNASHTCKTCLTVELDSLESSLINVPRCCFRVNIPESECIKPINDNIKQKITKELDNVSRTPLARGISTQYLSPQISNNVAIILDLNKDIMTPAYLQDNLESLHIGESRQNLKILLFPELCD